MRLPALAVVLALVGVTACDTPLPGQGTRSLGLYGGAVTVQGPEGYCVDPGASRPDSGFAVMGACGLLVAAGMMPQTDGFITVQVGAAGTATVAGSEGDLAELLRTPQGAALLTDAGNARTVTLGQIDRGEGLVSVRFADSAAPPVEGLMQEEWRAFLDLDDRLVTIGVRGYARAPLTAGQAQGLLYGTVDALRRAN
jgi:hypothetical protein